MTSVAHNGFGCPYCRAKMAEEPEEDEETVYSDEEEEEEVEVFDDSALRGFRFFWNNLNGEEHDAEDQQEEEAEEESIEDAEEEEYPVPTASFVAQKLQQQGVSYEDLVKMILLQHEEYADEEDFERLDNETFGKVRIIVSNYTPEQAVEPVPQPLQEPVPQPVQAPVIMPVIAEPKIYSRRIMIHV